MTLDPSKLVRVYPESIGSYKVDRRSLPPNVIQAIIIAAAHDVYDGESSPYLVPSPITTPRHYDDIVSDRAT